MFAAVSNSSEGRKYLQKEYDAALGLFYVELPDGTVLSHTLEENEVFPAQFGREVNHFMQYQATFKLYLRNYPAITQVSSLHFHRLDFLLAV